MGPEGKKHEPTPSGAAAHALAGPVGLEVLDSDEELFLLIQKVLKERGEKR